MDSHLTLNEKGKLNIYTDTWGLNVPVCPCDVHFNDFVTAKNIRNASIFHFGTGSHHIVGLHGLEGGRNNAVLGITASTGEYESYIQLLIERPELGNVYKAYFGDIYQLDPRLLPEFDVVTLFHLCEFRTETNDAYGALTDLEMATVLTDRIRPGGWLLFYTGSMAFEQAKPVIAALERRRPLERHPDFKTLRVYRKRAATAKAKTGATGAKARAARKRAGTRRKTK